MDSVSAPVVDKDHPMDLLLRIGTQLARYRDNNVFDTAHIVDKQSACAISMCLWLGRMRLMVDDFCAFLRVSFKSSVYDIFIFCTTFYIIRSYALTVNIS